MLLEQAQKQKKASDVIVVKPLYSGDFDYEVVPSRMIDEFEEDFSAYEIIH
jgi:hypothetical protein